MNIQSSFYPKVAVAFFILLSINCAADIVAKSYDIQNVESVLVSGAGHIELVQGDSESLRVEAEQDVMERVVVDLTGSKLKLGVKNMGKKFNFFDWFSNNDDEVKYFLQLKNVKFLGLSGTSRVNSGSWVGKNLEVDASGASEVKFADLALEDFFVELTGASSMRFQQLKTTKAKFKLSGAADVDVKASSKAEFLKVDASGASNFRGKLFTVGKADVDASGASNIDLHATEFLKAHASGASNIHYLGTPKLDSDSSGASNIKSIKP